MVGRRDEGKEHMQKAKINIYIQESAMRNAK